MVLFIGLVFCVCGALVTYASLAQPLLVASLSEKSLLDRSATKQNPSASNVFALLLHKKFQYLAPHFTLVCFFTNLILIEYSPLFIFTMWCQVLLYLAGVLTLLNIPVVSKLPGVKQLSYLVVVNAALLSRWVRYLSGTTKGNRKRTEP